MKRWLLLGLTACAGTSETADTALCTDAPVVTWASWGDGFLRENCQSCHGEGTQTRNGAPESVVFDSYEDVQAQADDIYRVATGTSPSMPPEGGVSEEQRWLLEVWLDCYGGE